MTAICANIDNSGTRIGFDYVEIDADMWLEERTGGEIVSLTDSLTRFIEHYQSQPGQEYTHVTTAVYAYLETVDPDNLERVDIHMVNTEHVLSKPLAVMTFTHPRHGDCVIAYWESFGWTGTPTVYADATSDSGYWYDYGQYEVCCPNGHGYTADERDVIDADGSYRSYGELWPDGMFTRLDDGDGHEGHDWHDSYALLCPECGACCSVAMPRL